MPVKWFPKKLNAAVKQQAKDAVLRTAFAIEADAKRLVSVDFGRLKASISVNWSGSGMGRGKVGAQAEAGDGIGQPSAKAKDELMVVVGTNTRYALHQEFGPKPASGKKWKFRPYLRPAFEKNKHRLNKNFKGRL